MILSSCQNCWFNGLQYGSLGLAVGYCVRHKKILNSADGTTCGLHVRKDLPLEHALQVSSIHCVRFDLDAIVRISDGVVCERDASSNDRDLIALKNDEVASAVIDFGELGTKIASLAQLDVLSSARAETAMLSLSRGYVRNCKNRGGSWTSGLHLFWWTRKRLADIPRVNVEDIRTVGATQLARQQNLVAWSVIMLRLCLIEDIAKYASEENDPLKKTLGLLDAAAENVQTFNLNRLSAWLKKVAVPRLDKYLPYGRYKEISQELHRDEE